MKSYGPWVVQEELGRGGSGLVFKVQNSVGQVGALKVLKRKSGYFESRFLDEIRLYRDLGKFPGILPIIDTNVTTDSWDAKTEPPWFVMACATPVANAVAGNLRDVVRAIHSYAHTLAELADRNIFHRDLKPANLYVLDSSFLIGDFGIADFPHKTGITKSGDRLGPANYLAPEMIEYSGDVESGPADVYALAKTLWALASNSTFPPPGVLRQDTALLRLSSKVNSVAAQELDYLLERSTVMDPEWRPSIVEFRDELSSWLLPKVEAVEALSLLTDQIKKVKAVATTPPAKTHSDRLQEQHAADYLKIQNSLGSPILRELISVGFDHGLGELPRATAEFASPEQASHFNTYFVGFRGVTNSWIVLRAGVVYEKESEPFYRNLALKVVLSEMTPESQVDSLSREVSFKNGSIALNGIINTLREEVLRVLREVTVPRFLNGYRSR